MISNGSYSSDINLILLAFQNWPQQKQFLETTIFPHISEFTSESITTLLGQDPRGFLEFIGVGKLDGSAADQPYLDNSRKIYRFGIYLIY